MMGLPPPPPLILPQIISASAPESRIPSAVPTPRPIRRTVSQPVSPIAKKKAQLKPPASSPTRALRKHHYHVTFTTHNPRNNSSGGQCPVHSYVTADQEIAVLPRHAAGGAVKFSEAPRLTPGRAVCPVHVYSAAKSELSALGSSTFAKHEDRAPAVGVCPVHSYGDPASSLRQRPATFAKFLPPRNAPLGSGPEVHAYANSSSMLRKTGAVAFGSTIPRGSLLSGLSRTGLVPAPATPIPTQATKDRSSLTRLPKLEPLAAGSESPREVEVEL